MVGIEPEDSRHETYVPASVYFNAIVSKFYP